MRIPWARLNLLRFRAVDRGRELLFVEGAPATDAQTESDEGLPIVFYGAEGIGSEGALYDARTLARALHPSLSDHELETVCNLHGLAYRPKRVEQSVGEAFVALVGEAIGLDREPAALLAQLLPEPLGTLLSSALLTISVRGTGGAEAPTDDAVPQDARSSDERVDGGPAFGPDGFIARSLPAYEERDGQVAMAKGVSRVLNEGGALVVEAGPGTGKTFAYLIPVIEYLKRDLTARVVVSTRTKQLQEQLFDKDLPFLVARMAPDLKIALLKGRENYLCLRRWGIAVREMTESLERDRLRSLAPLARWLWETRTGDVDENVGFLADPGARELWRRICDSALHCIDPVCPYGDECFSIGARRRARKADLVVVNHALLLNDLTVERLILGKYTHLIVDEAHALEEAARSAFTATLAPRVIDRIADELSPSRRRRTGWLQRIPQRRGDEDARSASDLVGTLRTVSARLFDRVGRLLPEERRGELPPLVEAAPVLERLVSVADRLESAIEGLMEGSEEPELEREGVSLSGSVRELSSLCRLVGAPAQPDAVNWYEREPAGLSLNVTPLEVAPILVRLLYPEVEGIVMTSATLSVGGDFRFIVDSLGLADGFEDVKTEVVDSPFSYEEHMRICVPSAMALVTGDDGEYAKELAGFLGDLAGRVDRKGLVLFTSYRLLAEVRRLLPEGVAAIAQGLDGPRSKLVERFRRHAGGILLFGTDSFWEGVDFPGEELEVVVVTRLPFAVPTDPIQSALGDLYARSGRDPFLDLALPRAVLKLRQGVGRLIRTRRDRGAIVLSDRRILTKGYGRAFAQALPVSLEVFDAPDALIDDLGGWLDRVSIAPCEEAD